MVDDASGRVRVIAYLFPGQGAQHVGMIAALPDREPVTAVLRTVSDVLARDVRELDGPDILTDTVAAQLGLLTVGVATATLLASDGIHPDAVAGHSIGAFAAAVVAGVLTLEEATDAVRVRAEGMRDLYPTGFGLLALLGARLSDAERLTEAVRADDDLFVAMENAVDQVVLAGSDAAFDRARAVAPRFGFREVRRLDVAVPSHCALMAPVADSVTERLREIPIRQPRVRYVAAMTARTAPTTAAVLADLAGGVAHMVRWRDTTDLLTELGTTVVAQLPPGHTTAALFSAAHPTVPVVALGDSSYDDAVTRLRITTERAARS